jgi:hypothetical protein
MANPSVPEAATVRLMKLRRVYKFISFESSLRGEGDSGEPYNPAGAGLQFHALFFFICVSASIRGATLQHAAMLNELGGIRHGAWPFAF